MIKLILTAVEQYLIALGRSCTFTYVDHNGREHVHFVNPLYL